MSQSMSFTADSVGGEYKHRLSESEIPAHRHHEYISVYGYEGWSDFIAEQYGVIIDYTSSNYVATNQKFKATQTETFANTGYAGGNGEHNNIQPFIVTFFWKRIK